jgi:hypothetical protein
VPGNGQDYEDYKCFCVEETDENGEKLSFYNILHALNYLSTKGWEFISLSPLNPENNTSINEQYAIIRKMMPIEEAKKYATPKPKKK